MGRIGKGRKPNWLLSWIPWQRVAQFGMILGKRSSLYPLSLFVFLLLGFFQNHAYSLKLTATFETLLWINKREMTILVQTAIENAENYPGLQRLVEYGDNGLRRTLKEVCSTLTEKTFNQIYNYVLEDVPHRQFHFFRERSLSNYRNRKILSLEDSERLLTNLPLIVNEASAVSFVVSANLLETIDPEGLWVNNYNWSRIKWNLLLKAKEELLEGHLLSFIDRYLLDKDKDPMEILQLYGDYATKHKGTPSIHLHCAFMMVSILQVHRASSHYAELREFVVKALTDLHSEEPWLMMACELLSESTSSFYLLIKKEPGPAFCSITPGIYPLATAIILGLVNDANVRKKYLKYLKKKASTLGQGELSRLLFTLVRYPLDKLWKILSSKHFFQTLLKLEPTLIPGEIFDKHMLKEYRLSYHRRWTLRPTNTYYDKLQQISTFDALEGYFLAKDNGNNKYVPLNIRPPERLVFFPWSDAFLELQTRLLSKSSCLSVIASRMNGLPVINLFEHSKKDISWKAKCGTLPKEDRLIMDISILMCIHGKEGRHLHRNLLPYLNFPSRRVWAARCF